MISDGGSNKAFVNDGKYASYYESNSSECYIGVDIGDGRRVILNRIRYFPYNKWTITAEHLKGATI